VITMCFLKLRNTRFFGSGNAVRREVAEIIVPYGQNHKRNLLFHQQYPWVAKREGNDPSEAYRQRLSAERLVAKP
jgi:hypothetical protein